jgi:hypothetical protein
VVTSVALAAVQYVPLLTFARLSTRANTSSFEFSASLLASIGHLVMLIVPNFFGEVIRMGTWGVESQQEVTHYVGVLIFFLAVAGVRLLYKRDLAFFLGLALGALVLQLGPDGILFTFFYRFVPSFSMTRGPARAGLIYMFAAITAAGLVWSELERASQESAQNLLGVFSKNLIWIISSVVIGTILFSLIVYATFRATGVAWTWHLAVQLTQFLVLFWATMALFAAWKNRNLTPGAINVLAAAVLMFDLWSYGLKGIRPGSDLLASLWPDVANFMQHKSDYRVAPEFDMEFYQNNGYLIQHIRSHLGYDPLMLARYQVLLDSAPDYFDRVYDLLNIKYMIATGPYEFQENGPRLDVVFERQGLVIYQRPNPLPRAFIVHEAQIISDDQAALAALRAAEFEISQKVTLPTAPPCSLEPTVPSTGETAQVVGESPNHLELTTRSESAGLLVLSEVDYPGWQARVDGQPAQVLRADTTLRAVCLPAGSHTVKFDFRPSDLGVGAMISCLAWVVVIGVVSGGLISARRTRCTSSFTMSESI